jgi:hypothetical protein
MGVSYTDPTKKRFQNAILGWILLRKNFWNSVLVRSATKISLDIRIQLDLRKYEYLQSSGLYHISLEKWTIQDGLIIKSKMGDRKTLKP